MIGDRFATPAWADTQAEADAWADAVDAARDANADRRAEARDSDFVMGGDVPEDHPLMLAWRNVQEALRA